MKTVYLDYHATTPLDERVLEKMLPFLTTTFGNPGSKAHSWGMAANAAVKAARNNLAGALRCEPDELLFTSCATESINTALKGAAELLHRKGRHIVSVQTEHSAVLNTLEYLRGSGFEITLLPVNDEGHLDYNQLQECLRDDTILVTVMAANNETGVVHDIQAIGDICRERGILFHTDATQAAGRLPLHLDELHCDMLSLSAHKFYGPKGSGLLYLRNQSDAVRIIPLLHGGGQERGLRSGTLNTAGIVGITEAFTLAESLRKTEMSSLKVLRDRLWKDLKTELPFISLNGSLEQRLVNNLNICFHGIPADKLIASIRDIGVSSGSACSTGKGSYSHVLLSLIHI